MADVCQQTALLLAGPPDLGHADVLYFFLGRHRRLRFIGSANERLNTPSAQCEHRANVVYTERRKSADNRQQECD